MKKVVLVGAGGRALNMFAKPLATELADHVQFCGIYDLNRVRAQLVSEECGGVPVFDDFDRMIAETRPDDVIVVTSDATHHIYIIKALEADCNVISEKPMTIDAEKCRAILEAERRTGRKVTVTFNVRFMPYVARIKELLNEGAIGELLHVHLEWHLDTRHGADYFRRWHAELKNSGGLLVHKSTHHFDFVNWLVGSDPKTVYADGTRRFYGPTRKERGQRCLTCDYKRSCEFYFDITADEFTNKYYYGAEGEDGYHRDQCVFGERIDIYDTMAVNVNYECGALLAYSLVAYSPYEGWRMTINGTNGRLEAEQLYSGLRSGEPVNQIRYYNRRGELVTYDIPKAKGGHGGGDERLRRMLFVGDVKDTLGQQAGSWAGAMSLLIGAAANQSIATGRPVDIRDLIS